MNNNPLKQYFRRPAVYLKLPSGGTSYPKGVVNLPENGEFPVYPMTAIDEITSKTPDALFNGVAVTELIKSCVPDILDPWQINSADLDSILIAIKAASGGNELELDSTCPKCENEGRYGINLVAVLANMKFGDYDTELQLNDLAFKFRPLSYREMNDASLAQFELQKVFSAIEQVQDDKEKAKAMEEALKKITDLTMRILSTAIEYIKTPTTQVDDKGFILDYMKNCDKDSYTKIRDYNTKLKSSTELKPLDVKCTNCDNEYKQPFTLNLSDFFG